MAATSAAKGSNCLDLAFEGERLCKAGDCRGGISFFEAALQAGTDDSKTLSAIYSQMGNAYFYLGDYNKAMEFHKLDLDLARSMSDRLGEAKASGNLGNTLKVVGSYDEAAICCERHFDISVELGDKVGQGRALYNLGNVFHAKGKGVAKGGGGGGVGDELSEEIRICFHKAIEYYQANLELMIELGDRSALGRACGNIGNIHYLLGDFETAVEFHLQRANIAIDFNDKLAERRAYSNLGNSHVFMGQFDIAADYYKKMLAITQELHDRALEAQACYCLGNTHTLLRNFPMAIDYHLKHLKIAQELRDRIGEARACWSLSNAHASIGTHDKALKYASNHLDISKEIGDKAGIVTAQTNVNELRNKLGLSPDQGDKENKGRRASVESTKLADSKLKDIGRSVSLNSEMSNSASRSKLGGQKKQGATTSEEDDFFDLLTRFQSERMEDQRCSLAVLDQNAKDPRVAAHPRVPGPGSISQRSSSVCSGASANPPSSVISDHSVQLTDDLFDLIAGMQSKRLDEQRASLPGLNNNVAGSAYSGFHPTTAPVNPTPPPHNRHHRMSVDSMTSAGAVPDENFIEMLMRCQSSRIEDQRTTLPGDRRQPAQVDPAAGGGTAKAPTMPDEDFFSLIVRLQSGRIEDQRSVFVPAPQPQQPTANGGSVAAAAAAAAQCEGEAAAPSKKNASTSLLFGAGTVGSWRSGSGGASSLKSFGKSRSLKGTKRNN